MGIKYIYIFCASVSILISENKERRYIAVSIFCPAPCDNSGMMGMVTVMIGIMMVVMMIVVMIMLVMMTMVLMMMDMKMMS